jgi:hypothetical protein
MIRMKFFSTALFLLTIVYSTAQTGGMNSFPLLDLTFNARAAGLGNDFITAKDNDINLGIANPSLYNEGMHKQLSVNQALMAGGINYGQVAYGHKLKKGVIGSSIRYLNYGEFTRTDIAGTATGTFNPFECIIGAGYGQQLNPRISVGANFNLIYSQLESYNSFGAALDLGGTYLNEQGNLLVTALVKNAGFQFDNYYGETRSPLPADFQLATSYKLAHAPFRFSILAHHLNKWDLTYTDPNLKPEIDALTGDTIPVKYAGFGEKLARHFTYSMEILVSKNIHLRTGFDYQRRQELKVESRPGIAGFTFGFGMYFKKFSLDYGFSVFSRAGFNNMLTLSTDLSKWRK